MEQLRTGSAALRRDLARAQLLSACRRFLRTDGDGLIAALEGVAGRQGARRALRLSVDLDTATRWQSGFAPRLARLRDLLLLEHLGGDWPETMPDPGVLDPASALAERCCWYADRIQDLLDAAEHIASRDAA